MKISVRGKNIEITEAIEAKISEKLSKFILMDKNLKLRFLLNMYF